MEFDCSNRTSEDKHLYISIVNCCETIELCSCFVCDITILNTDDARLNKAKTDEYLLKQIQIGTIGSAVSNAMSMKECEFRNYMKMSTN
jgi:hypothetical protein